MSSAKGRPFCWGLIACLFFFLEIQECASNPCSNLGVCEEHLAYFTCACATGFTGTTCEEGEGCVNYTDRNSKVVTMPTVSAGDCRQDNWWCSQRRQVGIMTWRPSRLRVYCVTSGRISQLHDDVIKWKHFPRYWPFVRGNHHSPVDSPHKGQWRGALMFYLICAWGNRWAINRDAGDLRHHCLLWRHCNALSRMVEIHLLKSTYWPNTFHKPCKTSLRNWE